MLQVDIENKKLPHLTGVPANFSLQLQDFSATTLPYAATNLLLNEFELQNREGGWVERVNKRM